jgi:hypothetical protein
MKDAPNLRSSPFFAELDLAPKKFMEHVADLVTNKITQPIIAKRDEDRRFRLSQRLDDTNVSARFLAVSASLAASNDVSKTSKNDVSKTSKRSTNAQRDYRTVAAAAFVEATLVSHRTAAFENIPLLNHTRLVLTELLSPFATAQPRSDKPSYIFVDQIYPIPNILNAVKVLKPEEFAAREMDLAKLKEKRAPIINLFKAIAKFPGVKHTPGGKEVEERIGVLMYELFQAGFEIITTTSSSLLMDIYLDDRNKPDSSGYAKEVTWQL